MQNNRKTIGIILIIIGLVIVGLLVYFLLIQEDELINVDVPPVDTQTQQLPTGPEIGTTTPSDRPVSSQQYDVSQEQAHQIGAADLAKRAMLYSERLGSYSSQSDYSNFIDLKIYMTEDMRDWVDQEVLSLQTKNRNSGYYGIETKAITTEILNYDDQEGTAEIKVTTERRESRDLLGGGESFSQVVRFSFVKGASDWLIDGAYFE